MSHDAALDTKTPTGQPAGLWVLIFTETWERFSHYGMRALLILYLTAPVALGASLLLWLVVSRIIHRLMGGYS